MKKRKLSELKRLYSGKVRDLYEIDDKLMLMAASDRLSAFDVILNQTIPGKGELLTAISNFWFKRFEGLAPNHFAGLTVDDVLEGPDADKMRRRAVVARRLKPIKCEAIVRGYLSGSGWKDYKQTGTVCGLGLPSGLRESEKLPEIIFTPSTKAEKGDHDVNVEFSFFEDQVGSDVAQQVRELAIKLYSDAAKYALGKGIVIADTKFEFGLDENGVVTLMDEVLTPDSSRFWPLSEYEVGRPQASFDKQFVRDYLESVGWDKHPPAPDIPDDVIQKTLAKYKEAYRLLTGQEF